MNTDLISNQTALFFKMPINDEKLKIIKRWLIDEERYNVISSFPVIDDLPVNIPVLQIDKVDKDARFRVNIAKSRLDIFTEPLSVGKKYNDISEAVKKIVNMFINKIYEEGDSCLVRIGCVNSFFEQMEKPENTAKKYVSDDVWKKTGEEKILDSEININTEGKISVDDEDIRVNRLLRVMSGNAQINGVSRGKGLVIIADANNFVKEDGFSTTAAIDLFEKLSQEVTESRVIKQLLD